MTHKHLSDAERLELSILLGKGYSQREIASVLGRSQSSLSREMLRNSVKGRYEARMARQKARVRRKASKYQGMKVRERPELEAYIVEKLELRWTPEEIAGRLKEIDTHLPYLSAKGIYKWLYSAYGQRYCHLLPKKRYRPSRKERKKGFHEMIPNRISIELRPLEANTRSEFGHFEEDTMVSGRRTKSKVALAVFCERKSRYSRISKMNNMRPETHLKAQYQMAHDLKMKTITYDNGIENKHHEKLAKRLKVKTFFCDPYSSWQKGTVENTIGRLRRFIPKGSNLASLSDHDVQILQHWLNHTPRKCLKFYTPYEIMSKNLQFISSSQ